jgi:ABC-2 type transport system permease protein
VALFGALFVVQATVSFWTIESLEVMNVLTFGGVTAAQYPVSIYRGHFRDLLTYVLPLACLNYLPALVILGRPDELGLPAWAPWASPLVGPLALLVALGAFRLGTRWYQSAGS